jgi:methionyl-tRNA formyltransferase
MAVPALERLIGGRHDVVVVVSQPDRRRGRGRKVSPSAVSQLALEAGIALLRPEKVGTRECAEELRGYAPDIGVVVAFGQFLPKRVRELPSRGYLINAHASLLPGYRGASPIARAIAAGERRTGISLMRIEREMDAGPVALVRELEVGADENAGELTERLAQLAAEVVEAGLEEIAAGSIRWSEQDEGRASYAPKITREEARLDWCESAEVLARQVRALAPRPGAFSELDGEPLRILAARAQDADAGHERPGCARQSPEDGLRIATGRGWLLPLRLQRAGGKVMDVDTYLRGHPISDGAQLGEARPDRSGRTPP